MTASRKKLSLVVAIIYYNKQVKDILDNLPGKEAIPSRATI